MSSTAIEQLHAVPNLTTALTGPLQQIEEHLLDHQAEIEQWFRSQWLETPAPFYASVDLRNAGFKLSPVDTNLFPAGFNNLNPAFQPLCVHAMQSAAERINAKACGALLIPEDHTRNPHYWDNVAALMDILTLAGFKVRVSSVSDSLTQDETLTSASGRKILRQPMSRDGDKIKVGDYTPCFVLLNNDLSEGSVSLLEDLAQPVVPPPALGWAHRRKSDHFREYDRVAEEFSSLIQIDSWLINPLFRHCGEIDFQKREGENCLTKNVTELLKRIGDKYREYGIDQEPFVFIKADTGTYGRNIMTVRSPEEIQDLNRKQRNKMARGKGGSTVSDVIVQEGVHTFETWGSSQAVAEPVVYMIDHFVVGGFYRVHTQRGPYENLNSPGMHFEPLAFAESCARPDRNKAPDAEPNRFYAYGVVARLALLAAAREMAALTSQ